MIKIYSQHHCAVSKSLQQRILLQDRQWVMFLKGDELIQKKISKNVLYHRVKHQNKCMVLLILQWNNQHFGDVRKLVGNSCEYDRHSNRVDHLFVWDHPGENILVDSQLNEIDPRVNDENEQVLELFEHEWVKLNHYVELNSPNPRKKKNKFKYRGRGNEGL